MLKAVKTFLKDDCGAITVDWVALTAGIVALGIIVMTSLSSGLVTAAGTISDEVGAMQVTGI